MITLQTRTIALLAVTAFALGCAEHHNDAPNEPTKPAQESKKENKPESKKEKSESEKSESSGNNEQKFAQQEPKTEQPPQQNVVPQPRREEPEQKAPAQEDSQKEAPQVTASPAPQEQTQAQAPPPEEQPGEESPGAKPTEPPKTLAEVIDAKEKVEKDLVTYLSTTDPVTLDDESVLLTNEIFTVTEDMPLKVLQIQAALGRLKKNDLYTPEVRDRVVLLQNKVNDHAKTDENIEYIRDGVYLLGSGALIGALSGLHFYGKLPVMTTGAARGIRNSFRWTASKLSRENLAALAAFRAPSTESVLHNNLKDLGLSPTQRSLISSLKKVDDSDLPAGVTFLDTPKPTLRFAVLDHTADAEKAPLGINRILAFRQTRVIRGSPFETTYVTDPIHAQAVGIMSSRLRRGLRGSDQRFARLKNFIDRAGVRIKPYFADFDVPNALGTGVATTAALTAVYLYGYENGRLVDLQGNMDLEALVNSNPP